MSENNTPGDETIDSGPIKVEVPIEAVLDEAADAEIIPMPEQGNALGEAIAAHFGVEVDAIDSFVLTVQYRTEEGTSCSSAWSAISPAWVLRGLVAEGKRHTDGL